MPSVKPPQLAVLALCGALGAGSLAGCETTQEKASAQRAESERILEARAQRKATRKHHKHDADGTESGAANQKSSRQQKSEKGAG
ncbi:MAG: hypothetical protein ACJ76D_04960 [Solirubrobacterales bacterium]